ncbi:unnamed protein product [Meganyctiphanes norvegica]|uniref:Uncharacterized protein n=1 Tax=Meganyctiphanes norvegica TaxID=48144 RepID=A0AAV2PQ75_MEGNR
MMVPWCPPALAAMLAVTMAVAAALPAPGASHSAPEVAAAPVAPQHNVEDQRLHKRSIPEEATHQELSVLRDAIIARLANEIQGQYPEYLTETQDGSDKKKRMFVPLSGLPGELPTIKRQIRYHQCYFNPISCFRRK